MTNISFKIQGFLNRPTITCYHTINEERVLFAAFELNHRAHTLQGAWEHSEEEFLLSYDEYANMSPDLFALKMWELYSNAKSLKPNNERVTVTQIN